MAVYLLVHARVCKIQACDIPQLKRVPASFRPARHGSSPPPLCRPCGLARLAGSPCSLPLAVRRAFAARRLGLKAAAAETGGVTQGLPNVGCSSAKYTRVPIGGAVVAATRYYP